METIEIINGYVPGAVGAVTLLHGLYYAEYWNLGLDFEAKVATDMAEFLSRYNPAHDGLWLARCEGEFVGAIIMDGAEAAAKGARLRFFILKPGYQGKGLGNQLMQAAMDFCKQAGFKRVYLTTFAGLDAARHLYEKHGFRQTEWQGGLYLGNEALVTQQFELVLD